MIRKAFSNLKGVSETEVALQITADSVSFLAEAAL